MERTWERDWILERRTPNHLAIGISALVVSMILHLVLLETAPSVHWNRPELKSPSHKRPELRLREVRREPPPPAPAPVRTYNPAQPDGALASVPAPKEFMSALDPVLLEPPAIKIPLAGEQSALHTPAPAPRSEWVPRQERIEIDRKQVRLERPELPRRILPQTQRIAAAPDIAVPARLPEIPTSATPPARSEPDPQETLRQLSVPGARGDYTPGGRLGASMVPGVPIRIGDSAGIFNERPELISSYDPVEHLLRLEVESWIPPDEPEWRYFTIRILRAGGTNSLPVLPKDVLFVQDCSESMTPAKVEACKEGLRLAVERLNPGDRFEIMSFQERQQRCFQAWTPFDLIQASRGNVFIEQMRSRGRTDIFGSLQQILRIPRDPGRPFLAVFVTDGRPTVGVQDTFEIIQQFSEHNRGEASIFCMGGGTRVNRFLLDFLSYANRGDSTIVRERAEIPQGIESLARSVNRPVLADLQVRFSGLDAAEVFPRRLTHLYLDRPLTLHGRLPAATPQSGTQMVGRSGAQTHDMVFRLDWSQAKKGNADTRADWQWQRLTWLVGEHIRTGDPALRAEIIRLSKGLDRMLPYAAALGIPDAPMAAE